MATNPIKYSDFIQPDNSIQDFIKQLEQLQSTYAETLNKLRTDAEKVEASLKKVSTATKEGQKAVKEAASKADELTKAQEKLRKSQSNTGLALTKLKQIQSDQNKISANTINLNRSKEGSYNQLSSQYNLNKIRLNAMSEAERKNTATGKKLEKETRVIYEKMKQLQKATTQQTSELSKYELTAARLTKSLEFLNSRQQQIAATVGKQSQSYKLVQAEIKKTKNSLKNLTSAHESHNSILLKTIDRVRILTGVYIGMSAIRSIFIQAKDSIVSFEAQMSSLLAISGANSKQFKALRDDALRLGAATTKTAREVGALQTEYAKLGYSTQEILEATEATIMLAEATKEDVATSAETAGGVVRALGKDAAYTQHIVDIMASSFTSSALNLERFTESVKYTAPNARAASVSIENLTGMLSVLADNLIRGSMAGRAMRRILLEIDKTGKPVGERLRELAEKGITLADAEDEVGFHAQTALLILANNVDKIDELTKQYENSAGAAREMARIQRDNIAGATELATSAWNGFIIALTEGSNILRTILGWSKSIAEWLTKNIRVIKDLLKAITLVTIAWGSYKLAIIASRMALWKYISAIYADITAKGLMTAATNAATGAMHALNTAIKLNPVGTLTSIIITAISAVTLFKDRTREAADEQEKLNEQLDDTNNLIGKKIYENFLAGTLKLRKEIISTPYGNKEIVKGFDDSIKIVDELTKKVKTLNETGIKALGVFFERSIFDIRREIDNLELGETIDPKKLEDLKKYESYLKIINTELKRISKLQQRPTVVTIDEEEQKRIRDLQISIMSEGQQKELAELEKKYADKKALFIKYSLDIGALNTWYQNEVLKINKSYAEKERDQKIAVMEDGQQKELAVLEKNYDDRKEQFKKLGLDLAKVEEWYQKEIEKINDKYRKKEEDRDKKEREGRYKSAIENIEQEYDLRESEIDIMKANEGEKTRLRLQMEKERLQKILDLNKGAEKQLSDLQIKTIENTIAKIDQELKSSNIGGYDLYSLLGISLSSEKKEAISESTQFAMGQIQDLLQSKIEAANAAVDAANTEVDAAKNRVNQEIEARNNGYASNVSLAQKELELAKKNQEKALREQEKAQKAQARLETIMQATNLVSASAKIWKQLGFPFAIPALAIMWGSFAAAKIKAAQITKQKQYKEGGLEFLDYGGSHASGNDIGIGTTKTGEDRRAERGEALAIFKKSSTKKYRSMLPQIVESINKGVFEKKYANTYDTKGIVFNLSQSNPDLHKLERDVNDIKKQGERKYFIDGKGRTIETYKNLRRIYNAN